MGIHTQSPHCFGSNCVVKVLLIIVPYHQLRTLYTVFLGFPSVSTSKLWSRFARTSGVFCCENMRFKVSDSWRSCERMYTTTPETNAT
jgi:hypothetical protein